MIRLLRWLLGRCRWCGGRLVIGHTVSTRGIVGTTSICDRCGAERCS